ncbi:dihydropteroate synthase, partial [Acinetobacter baumannii]
MGPVVQRLARRDVRVSVDTSKPDVAQRALESGAWMINDVNGLRDPDMLDLVGLARCHVCIMHMQGDPR